MLIFLTTVALTLGIQPTPKIEILIAASLYAIDKFIGK